MCPLCRSAVTADKLLEAASSNDEDTVENDKTEAFEDIIVNVSSSILYLPVFSLLRLKGVFNESKCSVEGAHWD
jgi:hypothetical protein